MPPPMAPAMQLMEWWFSTDALHYVADFSVNLRGIVVVNCICLTKAQISSSLKLEYD